eukprot:UN25038
MTERDVKYISHQAIEALKLDPQLMELDAPITIVGDIHGQFQDLVRIFHRAGFPSKEKRYLFLGDIVDRGHNSVECATILFVCKILFPKDFFILRGNHEDMNISGHYGFLEECKRRFNSDKTFLAYNFVFMYLPFCAIVQKTLFCVHAGISQKFRSLDQLKSIKKPCKVKKGLTCDLIWSDPNYEPNPKLYTPNQIRGTSFLFSEKALEIFLKKVKCSRLIRAHELCDYGYQVWCNGKFLTDFLLQIIVVNV